MAFTKIKINDRGGRSWEERESKELEEVERQQFSPLHRTAPKIDAYSHDSSTP